MTDDSHERVRLAGTDLAQDAQVLLTSLSAALKERGREDDAYYVEQTMGLIGAERDAIEEREGS